MELKITRQSPEKPFKLKGTRYNNLKELLPIEHFDNVIEWSKRFYLDGHSITKCRLMVGDWTFENDNLRYLEIYYDRYDNLILCKEELYPCFDSFDSASESRFYRLYIFCEDEEDARKKIEWIRVNDINVHSFNYLPKDKALTPMVYIDDGWPEAMYILE